MPSQQETSLETGPGRSIKQVRFWRGCLAGLLAGVVASLCIQIFSYAIGGVSLAEQLGSTIAQDLPLQIFSFLHDLLGADAKHDLLYVVLIGQCLVFAIFGGLCNLAVMYYDQRGKDRGRPALYTIPGELPHRVGIILATVLWLFSGFVFLPATGAGIFGAGLTNGLLSSLFSLAISALLFGLLFITVQNWLAWRQWQRQSRNETRDEAYSERRRRFLRNGLVAGGLGMLGLGLWYFIRNGIPLPQSAVPGGDIQDRLLRNYKSKITPPPQPAYGQLARVSGQSSYITANKDFYVVSKNLAGDPNVDATTWQMKIDGQLQHPYTLSYQQLMALPRVKQYESIMCISNDVGGDYMSNALWEGIPLKNLLQQAGTITPGASKVVLYAADNYSDSIHLAKALESTTMVAVLMNGVKLPTAHGYPARLLVPGIYGMKHVKWITHIEVVNTDYQGYWQQSGWSDAAPVKMTSRIDTPESGETLPANHQTYIAGVAFSGNKGISRVDISLDGAQSWQSTTLQRPDSSLTWVLWQLPWKPQSGNYTIIVRAVDSEGNVQIPQQAAPLPDGASGYHTITVTVA